MDTSKATPRPWRTQATWPHLVHGGPHNRQIADTREAHCTCYTEEEAANAALIVKAVNAHDALVEALRAVEADYMDRGDCALHTKLGTTIRAALALAEGGAA